MDSMILLRALSSLAVILLVLMALAWLARVVGRGRLAANLRVEGDGRLISIIESTAIAPNTHLHVMRVADRYYVVGGGSGHVALVSEISKESVAGWLASQAIADATKPPLAIHLAKLLKNRRAS